ncbi:MAG: DinB family protein [Bacillota bacterium]
MNVKEVFLEQLSACHNQNAWFVSLHHAIKDLSTEQASWKLNGSSNSIWEIVNHLNYYNEKHLLRFQGEDFPKGVDSNDVTFQPLETDWNIAVDRMNTILSDWSRALENCDEAALNKWVGHITHLTIHNAYHIGQIVHIRKQQEAWDPSQGVH